MAGARPPSGGRPRTLTPPPTAAHSGPPTTPTGAVLAVAPSSTASAHAGVELRCFHYRVHNDGYQWIKYGEKWISAADATREYYRCRFHKTLGCAARKKIDRREGSAEPGAEEAIEVTTTGEHNHAPGATGWPEQGPASLAGEQSAAVEPSPCSPSGSNSSTGDAPATSLKRAPSTSLQQQQQHPPQPNAHGMPVPPELRALPAKEEQPAAGPGPSSSGTPALKRLYPRSLGVEPQVQQRDESRAREFDMKQSEGCRGTFPGSLSEHRRPTVSSPPQGPVQFSPSPTAMATAEALLRGLLPQIAECAPSEVPQTAGPLTPLAPLVLQEPQQPDQFLYTLENSGSHGVHGSASDWHVLREVISMLGNRLGSSASQDFQTPDQGFQTQQANIGPPGAGPGGNSIQEMHDSQPTLDAATGSILEELVFGSLHSASRRTPHPSMHLQGTGDSRGRQQPFAQAPSQPFSSSDLNDSVMEVPCLKRQRYQVHNANTRSEDFAPCQLPRRSSSLALSPVPGLHQRSEVHGDLSHFGSSSGVSQSSGASGSMVITQSLDVAAAATRPDLSQQLLSAEALIKAVKQLTEAQSQPASSSSASASLSESILSLQPQLRGNSVLPTKEMPRQMQASLPAVPSHGTRNSPTSALVDEDQGACSSGSHFQTHGQAPSTSHAETMSSVAEADSGLLLPSSMAAPALPVLSNAAPLAPQQSWRPLPQDEVQDAPHETQGPPGEAVAQSGPAPLDLHGLLSNLSPDGVSWLLSQILGNH